ncbi:MAG: TRAP transporter small permease [Candidatus Binatia bacterium]
MNPPLDGLQRALTAIRRGAAVVAGLGVVAITALGVVDVAGRVLFNSPLLGQVEITRILLVYVAFLGLAEAERAKGHVRLGVLDTVLSPRARAVRECAITALAMIVAGVLTIAAAVFFWDSWSAAETMIAPIALPAWLGKLGVVVGFFLLTAQLALDLVRQLGTWTR